MTKSPAQRILVLTMCWLRPTLMRGSGLIEECHSFDGAQYVLHYNVEEWCDYLMNGYE